MTNHSLLRRAPQMPPHEVPGFSHARKNGAAPHVSYTPPFLSVTPSSKSRLLQGSGMVGGCLAVCFAAGFLGSTGGRLTILGAVGVLVSLAAAMVLVSRTIRSFERALLSELQQGYTTTRARGTWWLSSSPHGVVKDGFTRWDFRGTWVLSAKGVVVTVPEAGHEPPGLYPSPRAMGMLELWTGREWTGYRVPDHH
ncbi:hypothetical protein [Nocardioides piscis]|uniref:Uncharacterized protein n=1 Tax=Nocardioides piscis TaxID=2714938 RepID=A0A6G7YEK3_9ACTN|nr:hypothetical protein [Nocardioides piscis]QIK75223.1 hypothetical protein G7071_07075 [Nocardioides piscis]